MNCCQCTCCSLAGPPYPAGTFPVVRPPVPVVAMQPAEPVNNLPAAPSMEEVTKQFNELLSSMRNAGFLRAE